ncbi:hypothetical protein ES704_01790 [subsurface metagenome]
MVIKHTFKFLNTLSFSLEKKVMLLVGQGLQIYRSIVVWYSIKMVNNPAFRQAFTVCLFPYNDMFKDIASFMCSGVVRFKNKNITSLILIAPPSPTGISFSTARFQDIHFAFCPTQFCIAGLTPYTLT